MNIYIWLIVWLTIVLIVFFSCRYARLTVGASGILAVLFGYIFLLFFVRIDVESNIVVNYIFIVIAVLSPMLIAVYVIRTAATQKEFVHRVGKYR